jgi:hypothetical protein
VTTSPDPNTLVATLFDELVPTTWTSASPPDGIDAQWRSDSGAVLSVFAPGPQSGEELLAADMAALLASSTFEPADPLRDGNRLHGRLTAAAPAGPAWLDATVIADERGARRVVLQRPIEISPDSR